MAIISLKDVSVFQKDILILSGVNLEILEDEFVYLIGKTGSGKSSLIKTLYAELPIRTGQGHVAGFDLNKLKTKEIPKLRRKLGVVFQDFQLLIDRTVQDNLKFVLKATGWRDRKDIDKRIEEVLDMVGLRTKGFKMPHELSGGEQQRVVIARALLNDPDLILADEPTGNLDPLTSEGIMELLAEINSRGKAVFMATHNYNLIEQFPARIVRADSGQIHI